MNSTKLIYESIAAIEKAMVAMPKKKSRIDALMQRCDNMINQIKNEKK